MFSVSEEQFLPTSIFHVYRHKNICVLNTQLDIERIIKKQGIVSPAFAFLDISKRFITLKNKEILEHMKTVSKILVISLHVIPKAFYNCNPATPRVNVIREEQQHRFTQKNQDDFGDT